MEFLDYEPVRRRLIRTCLCFRVRAELRQAVERGLDAETSTLIAADIDRRAYDGQF
jgi:hypothetical protein